VGAAEREIVTVLAEDPDLARGLDQATLKRALPRSRTRAISIEPGDWSPTERLSAAPGLLGLLVLEGIFVRRITLGDRRSVELLGPGDLLRPFDLQPDRFAMIPSYTSWRVATEARLAVLDERFHIAMAGYPEIISELLGRLVGRIAQQGERLAIVQQPRLSGRIHFILWQLAQRYGRVDPTQVVLPLPLTHELLAELVSAQRPSVSSALGELEAAGLVSRRPGGGFVLPGRPLGDEPDVARAR
jgi:CRP-like cAMP-binding protein